MPTKKADEIKDQPKDHDDKHKEAQAGVDEGVEHDKIGSVDKDSAAGKVILEASTAPAKAGDAPNDAGLEGTGHSTLHVTGAPQVAEAALREGKKVGGQKPSIGRVVIYRESDYEVSAAGGGTNPEGTNGTREHPAIITRVWSESCVNLHVFFDMNTRDVVRSSVMFEGMSQDEVPAGVQVAGGNACWFWPPRV